MILHKSAKNGHGKIRGGVAERLPELAGISRQEIGEGIEKIESAKAVPGGRAQSDTIHHAASFPKMFAAGARVRVVRFIMIFTALVEPGIRPPEIHQSGDVDFRSGGVVGAQHGMARGRFKPQIAHSGCPVSRRERTGEHIVADEAAAARAYVGQARLH